MVHFLIILALSIGLIAALGGWSRDRRLLSESRKRSQDRDAEGASALEKANENLKALQADLQRRWQYLAEAQRLSHSGTFGWKVRSGELVWSDETYRILGFTRETNPTLDLVFDRIHPEDRQRLQQIRDRATENGMDLDVEHRIVLPDGVIKYLHAVAHAGRDSSGNLEHMGVVTDITERKRAEEERQALSRNLQESKARLEEAQRVARMGHYYWDLIANRVTWSDELYRTPVPRTSLTACGSARLRLLAACTVPSRLGSSTANGLSAGQNMGCAISAPTPIVSPFPTAGWLLSPRATSPSVGETPLTATRSG